MKPFLGSSNTVPVCREEKFAGFPGWLKPTGAKPPKRGYREWNGDRVTRPKGRAYTACAESPLKGARRRVASEKLKREGRLVTYATPLAKIGWLTRCHPVETNLPSVARLYIFIVDRPFTKTS